MLQKKLSAATPALSVHFSTHPFLCTPYGETCCPSRCRESRHRVRLRSQGSLLTAGLLHCPFQEDVTRTKLQPLCPVVSAKDCSVSPGKDRTQGKDAALRSPRHFLAGPPRQARSSTTSPTTTRSSGPGTANHERFIVLSMHRLYLRVQ